MVSAGLCSCYTEDCQYLYLHLLWHITSDKVEGGIKANLVVVLLFCANLAGIMSEHVDQCLTLSPKSKLYVSTFCSIHTYYHVSLQENVWDSSDRLSWGDDVWFPPGDSVFLTTVWCGIWCSEERRSCRCYLALQKKLILCLWKTHLAEIATEVEIKVVKVRGFTCL